MKNYYIIPIQGTEESGSFTSYLFYNQFLPEYDEYCRSNTVNDLMVDLSKIEKVNPLVIPNLINIGLHHKQKFGGRLISLFIPWNLRLIEYLRDIQFLEHVRKERIFNLFEQYLGGTSRERKLGQDSFTRLIRSEEPKDVIRYRYFLDIEELLNQKLLANSANEVVNFMIELCHNGANHSASPCFMTVQINKSGYFVFSIADSGVGFFDTIKGKTNNELKLYSQADFAGEQKSSSGNIAAIFEAIFFRNNTQTYGIHSVFNAVLRIKNAKIRFHTDNTQIVFTNDAYERYFKGISDLEGIKNSIRKFRDERSLNVKQSNVSYDGVHVEIEIPF